MNKLPIEILEMIFCLLPAGIDFEKCVNACTKWRKIIQTIYPNYDKSEYNNSIEAINGGNQALFRKKRFELNF